MITFITVSGKRLTFKNSDLNISTMGSDFIISLKGVPRALNWSEDDYISTSDLYKVITNEWTYIQEEDTDDECEDCEDDNCNNGCFFYRHKRVDSIRIFSNLADEILEACQTFDTATKESDDDEFWNRYCWSQNHYSKLSDDLDFLSIYFSIDNIHKWHNSLRILHQKADIYSDCDEQLTIDIVNPSGNSSERCVVHKEGVSCNWNFHLFFSDDYYINIDAYTNCNLWGDNKPGRLVTKIEIDGKKSNDDALNKIFIDEVTFKYLRLQKINGSNKYALISFK